MSISWKIDSCKERDKRSQDDESKFRGSTKIRLLDVEVTFSFRSEHKRIAKFRKLEH